MAPGSFDLEQAFRQFSLESERVETTHLALIDKFSAVQRSLEESNTRLSGKLVELDFLSRYLEAILNHISQGIIFIDLKGVVTTYNDAARSLLKVPDLLFHPFADFFDDSHFGFSLKEALHTLQCSERRYVTWSDEEQAREIEVETTFVSMSRAPYSISLKQSIEHPVEGLLILLRDMTRIRYLQQLADRRDRLHELGELAAHLAHEIRNPLGGIRGFATLLRDELKEREDLLQMASSIIEGTDALNQCVSNILDYTRPFQLHAEVVDVVPFVEDLRQLMLVDLSWNREISFTVNALKRDVFATIDPMVLKSALLNLFVNAMQAMSEGGELKVTIDSDERELILTVCDTGMGMSLQILSKIFSPFFSTKVRGTGLGLADVQKAISAHHGTISVISEEGKGSKFTIKLPLKVSL